ncbi:arf/Sar family, other [Saprolegnia diclina VS20]|uniref:Arf/Sar family, other n=1 Tax=Saprolegnia diclina (strain VS20) TaxID=1156394 RepID=T0PZA3_SAPDV|nr:arf/Sar family, other [Saprolegnia diclina VS20]EQC27566.1 arf/Sar family, other [Saprolegnia diclina VS20]|eukprot:XP_008618986.1 arf/Sar family, other [Saprolegnia diclina VS20]
MGADHSTPPPTKQRRVAILGPSGAGKTTLLLQWAHHATGPTLPTVGFNVETVAFEDTRFTMWDIPGQVALQPCWPQYCSSVDAVVFVVDATDRSSLGAARDALHAAFAVARPSRCLLVANKMDQPDCVDALELLAQEHIMGNLYAKLRDVLDRFSGTKRRIIMLGLDAAGKTTILYRLKLNETMHTLPTIGFNVETFSYKNVEFTAWDIGGQDKLRALWKYYYQNTDAIIFVVDATDRHRIDIAAHELARLLQEDELCYAKLLVFANKQDLPGAMSAGDVARHLKLDQVTKNPTLVQPCSAVGGTGLYEGLDWLSKVLTERH